MKSFYFLGILVAFLFSDSVHALAQPTIRMKVGGAHSQWRGNGMGILNSLGDATQNKLFSQQANNSYYAGIAAEWQLGEHFSIEPALQYARVGAILQGDFALKALSILGVGLQAKAVTQRIEMPVLLKAELLEGLHIVAGPQLNLAADSELRLQGKVLGINVLNQSMNLNNVMEPFSAAVVGGLEYQLSNGLQVHGLYEYGLTRIAKNNTADIYQNSLRIGIGIPIGRKG